MKFIGLFSIIIVFIIGGIYFGFSEFNGGDNLFGKISGVSNDDFQYVGEVVLSPESDKSESSSPKQKEQSKKQTARKTPIQLFANSAPINKNQNPTLTPLPTPILTLIPTTTLAIQASTTQIIETTQAQTQLEQTIQAATTTTEPLITEPPPASAPLPTSTIPTINHVLISEILFNAQGRDKGKEFIELYNPTNSDKDIKNWSLKALVSGSGSVSSLIKFGSKQSDNTVIKSKRFFLIGLNNYSGVVSSDAVRSASLPNSAATIYLSDADGNEIESISYPNDIEEGQSIERVSWDNNEFRIQSNPNPQNSQSN